MKEEFIILTDEDEDVNDLAVSPTNPDILASASADNTVRIWSLNRAHKKQPCAILCAGEGHLDTVLSVVCIHLHVIIYLSANGEGFPRNWAIHPLRWSRPCGKPGMYSHPIFIYGTGNNEL
jgi:WD40 repeat protein